MFLACVKDFLNGEARSEKTYFEPHLLRRVHFQCNIDKAICRHKSINIFTCNDNICNMLIERSRFPFCLFEIINLMGAPDKPCGVGRADANPKLLLNDT